MRTATESPEIPRRPLRRSPLVVVTAALVLLGAACGDSSEPVADVGDDDTTTGAESPDPDDGPDEPEPDDGSERDDSEADDGPDEPEPDDPDPEPDDDLRAQYVDAIVAEFEGAPPEMVDPECLGGGIVDAIGLDTLDGAGVTPDEFVGMDSIVDLGIVVTPELREAVAAAFEECFDGGVFALQMLASLEFGFPDDILTCVAESMGDVMETAIANEFIDGSGGLGPESFSDAVTIGTTCAAEAANSLPESAVTWGDGAEAFTSALDVRLSTPVFEGAAALPVDEARCFSTALGSLLGPQFDASPDITVGELMLFLSLARTAAEVGLAVDEALALEMAEANARCVDNVAITAEATAAPLRSLGIGEETIDAMVGCIGDSLDDAYFVESLRLQYQYGSEVFALEEYSLLVEESFAVGERCAFEAMTGG